MPGSTVPPVARPGRSILATALLALALAGTLLTAPAHAAPGAADGGDPAGAVTGPDCADDLLAVPGTPDSALPVSGPGNQPADEIEWLIDQIPYSSLPTDEIPGGMPDPLPFGGGPCPGVRPGALVRFNPVSTGGCTMNWAVQGRDWENKLSWFIGTAGHCVLSSDGEQAWAPGYGPVAWDARNYVIGRVAYAVRRPNRDFALIRLDPGVQFNPQMCYFGGPTAISYDQNNSLTELQYYGQGTMLASYSPARTAYAQTMTNPDEVFAYGLTVFGDSGAPVHSRDGRAVGLAVTIGGQVEGIANTGVIGIMRIGPLLSRAAAWVNLNLTLLTAAKLDAMESAIDSAKSLPHSTPDPTRPGPLNPGGAGGGGTGIGGGGGSGEDPGGGTGG